MMRRLHALALVLLLAGLGCLHLARSQGCTMLLCGAGKGATGGVVGYQGPIDAAGVSAKGAWGLRCLSAAYCGGNLANVCTDIIGVDTCLDFSSNSSTGNLTIVTIGGLSCAVVTCTIKILYDQSGASACSGPCDATQATVGNRAQLISSCQNSLPCARATSSQLYATPALGSTLSQPNWVSGVLLRGSGQGSWFGDSGANEAFQSITNQAQLFAGNSLAATSSDGSFHSVQMIANGASSEVYVDGSNTTGDAGTGNLSTALSLLTDGFANRFSGDITEIVLWNNVTPSSGQKSAVNSNNHTYWGF